jgi:hypothetical protein
MGEVSTLTGRAYKIADSGKYTIKQLRAIQAKFRGKSEQLLKRGKHQEAMDAASEHQMWREAAERMEGQAQHFKKVDPRPRVIPGEVPALPPKGRSGFLYKDTSTEMIK